MPLTAHRNRKPDAYHVIPKTPRYYAFHATETHLLATIYANDGTWLADRASIPLPLDFPTAENGTPHPPRLRHRGGGPRLALRPQRNHRLGPHQRHHPHLPVHRRRLLLAPRPPPRPPLLDRVPRPRRRTRHQPGPPHHPPPPPTP